MARVARMPAQRVNKIETTLEILVGAEVVLRRVAQQDIESAKARYHIARLLQKVSEHTRAWHQARVELINKLGVERDSRTPEERAQGPTVRQVTPAAMPEFRRQMEELNATPVVIEWGPVRSVDLPHASAADLVDLGPLCELVEP